MTRTVDFVDEPARRTPVFATTQVLVVGGGTAGVAAAVASARRGVDTMLVESQGSLGGLATNGLIVLLLTLDDGKGRQVVRGLCQEVVDRIAERGAAYFPPAPEWGAEDPGLVEQYRRWGLVWGSGPHRVRYSVAYDPSDLRLVLQEIVASSGVRLLLNVWACEALRDGDRVRGVVLQGKSGRLAIMADIVIDATGDGDIFASLGVPFAHEKVLPWLWFRMGGVTDPDAAITAGGWFFRAPASGQVLMPWGAAESIVRKIDATDPADLTRAQLECRAMVMEEVERLRRDVPGFHAAHVCEIAPQLGVTESRRLLGKYVLAREDVHRPFDDAIAITGHWTKYGAVYWIPYRSLLPDAVSNLLVAGRCISVDHRVHHATKEIPPCFATGEAAGTAAALAIGARVSVQDVDVSRLRHELEAQGAIVSYPPP